MPSKSPNRYTGQNPSKFPQGRLKDEPATEKPYIVPESRFVKVGEAPIGPDPIAPVAIEPTVVVPATVSDEEKTKKRKNRYKE
jgi:hypothetical protein